MVQTYAKVQNGVPTGNQTINGVVVDTQLLNPTDYMDPSFTWVLMDNRAASDDSAIAIGYIYVKYNDGSDTFSPPG